MNYQGEITQRVRTLFAAEKTLFGSKKVAGMVDSAMSVAENLLKELESIKKFTQDEYDDMTRQMKKAGHTENQMVKDLNKVYDAALDDLDDAATGVEGVIRTLQGAVKDIRKGAKY